MEKIIKSFFPSNERKRHSNSGGNEVNPDDEKSGAAPALDDRRKLSISRSGRMKQNKKRSTLSLEIFDDDIPQDIKSTSRLASLEYHVKNKQQIVKTEAKMGVSKIELSRTPEEEIDKAFEIVDKSLELTS